MIRILEWTMRLIALALALFLSVMLISFLRSAWFHPELAVAPAGVQPPPPLTFDVSNVVRYHEKEFNFEDAGSTDDFEGKFDVLDPRLLEPVVQIPLLRPDGHGIGFLPPRIPERPLAATPKKPVQFYGDPRHICDPISPIEIRIVAKVLGREKAERSPIRTALGRRVDLHAVMRARVRGREVVIGHKDVVAAAGFPANLTQWSWHDHEAAHLTWFKVEPEAYSASNTDPDWHWHKIPYDERSWRRGGAIVEADALPTNYDDNPRGYGTMRFKLVYDSPRGEVATRGAGSMGPTKKDHGVFEVCFGGKTPVAIVNHAYELFNVPYIWGSASMSKRDPDHQAEWRYGSDCADLVSYAARRAGYHIPYGWTGSFQPGSGLTKAVVTSPTMDEGVYYRGDGSPVRWGGSRGVERGDLVLFQGHIGVLARDVEPEGIFDAGDEIIHTLWRAPRCEGIASAFEGDFSVLRLKSSHLAE